MSNLNLNSIKRESIKSIYKVISESENINRAYISAKTDLSLMTVGKVVDTLLSLNLIYQTKEIKENAGRKAGIVNINDNYYCAVFDFTSKIFSLSIYSTKLIASETFTYHYNNELTYIENFRFFIRTSYDFISISMNPNYFIGIGISLPDSYDPKNHRCTSEHVPELNNICVYDEFADVFKNCYIYINTAVSASAYSNITNIKHYDSMHILYIFIGGCISGEFISDGHVISGSHHQAGFFGKIIDTEGKTINSYINSFSDVDSLIQKLAVTVYNLIVICDPDLILIEDGTEYRDPDFCLKIKQAVIQTDPVISARMPEIVTGVTGVCHSHRGLALFVRTNWLENIITKKM